ncbi:MAG: hypothetical protein M0018_12650, partial [Nitrospiraceae bacterium]|nr:hypothetical protein [Nitrospiraceae bacterium]
IFCKSLPLNIHGRFGLPADFQRALRGCCPSKQRQYNMAKHDIVHRLNVMFFGSGDECMRKILAIQCGMLVQNLMTGLGY